MRHGHDKLILQTSQFGKGILPKDLLEPGSAEVTINYRLESWR